MVSGAGLVRGLPSGAYAAALARLPGIGPAWLAATLGRHRPEQAWELVLAGELCPPVRGRPALHLFEDHPVGAVEGASGQSPPGRGAARPGAPGRDWASAARAMDVAALWAHCLVAGITVTWPGAPGYPRALVGRPEPPGVLFGAGQAGVLDRKPAVAIVGTRRCTPEGAATAFKFGYDLSRAGVCVVSGLALGIDGAGHAGALAAVRDGVAGNKGPGVTVGVAASGVDVVYPRQHAALWHEVQRFGAVISETPPGVPAQAWRFPSRNRVIAGLAQMVVVVECHAGGGSWHTVKAALERGTEVGAVPGSVHSPASVGTNTLLHEGAVPVRCAEDILDVVGAPEARAKNADPLPVVPAAARRTDLGVLDDRVLGGVGRQARSLDEIVERSGLPLTAVVVALERLEREGEVRGEAGWWLRRPH